MSRGQDRRWILITQEERDAAFRISNAPMALYTCEDDCNMMLRTISIMLDIVHVNGLGV